MKKIITAAGLITFPSIDALSLVGDTLLQNNIFSVVGETVWINNEDGEPSDINVVDATTNSLNIPYGQYKDFTALLFSGNSEVKGVFKAFCYDDTLHISIWVDGKKHRIDAPSEILSFIENPTPQQIDSLSLGVDAFESRHPDTDYFEVIELTLDNAMNAFEKSILEAL
jgi:hypothetical protein